MNKKDMVTLGIVGFLVLIVLAGWALVLWGDDLVRLADTRCYNAGYTPVLTVEGVKCQGVRNGWYVVVDVSEVDDSAFFPVNQ